MSQSFKQEQTEVLQEVCQESSTLVEAQSIFCRDNVVMDKHGNLISEDAVERGEYIMRFRKMLVLGLNGWEQHNLDKANDILSEIPRSTTDKNEIERFINNKLQ